MDASMLFSYQNPQPAGISMALVKDLHKVKGEGLKDII